MGKTNKQIVKFPTLNDRGGNVEKQWYVEWTFYIPGKPAPERQRKWIATGTPDERRHRANEIITEKTAWLKSGDYLSDYNITPVTPAQTYRIEAERYNAINAANSNQNIAKKFLSEKLPTLRKKTAETYKSKLKIFADWCDGIGLQFRYLERKHILDFLRGLTTERNLSRLSVEKYGQIVRTLYTWLIENEMYAGKNPAERLPKLGRIVDCAPAPIGTSDIERLHQAIEKNDPFLWLACTMQFYAAIRPGTELRLLKIKDIDREKSTIRIDAEKAKNKKTEIISVPRAVIKHLEKLGVFNYAPELYVFGQKGIPSVQPVGKNTLRNRFNRYREALHISTDIKFYSWKHTGAITALENGIPAYQLREHLRHASLQTTEHYIRKKRPTDFADSTYFGEI